MRQVKEDILRPMRQVLGGREHLLRGQLVLHSEFYKVRWTVSEAVVQVVRNPIELHLGIIGIRNSNEES